MYRPNRSDLMKACKFGNSPKVSKYDSKFKWPEIGQDWQKSADFWKKIPILAGKNRKNYFFLKLFGECPGVNIGLETCFFGLLGQVFIIFDHLIPPHGLWKNIDFWWKIRFFAILMIFLIFDFISFKLEDWVKNVF